MRTVGLVGCVTVTAWLTMLNVALAADPDGPVAADTVIVGGQLIDGTGSPARRADVAVKGDRIVAVGEFPIAPGARRIDASGMVVAPGFIDLHSHSDGPILGARTRSNLNYLTQGVTTVVTGNCGSGPIDARSFLSRIDRDGAGTNVILLLGHGGIRRAVLGNREVKAEGPALEEMKRLVEEGMKGGAWGLSSGLIYIPSRYGDVEELSALCQIVKRYGGLYASHIRDEEASLLDSIDEALTIGRRAGLPVHISHLKANLRPNWGLAAQACERIAAARDAGQVVTADQYPYTASSTSLGAMVVPHRARQGSAADFVRMIDDPVEGPKLRREIQEELDMRDGGVALRIARYPRKPSRVGKDLVTIAREEGTTPLEVVLDIERHGGAHAISFGMDEGDVRHIMAQPYVATASDGSAHVPGGGDHPHPRAYGTFPRKIRYALDEKVIPLEQAIHAGSGLPAKILGLPDRGIIRPGAYADIVVFEPRTFRDAATFEQPTRYATGLKYLLVNGVPTIVDGEYRGVLPGRAMRLDKDGPASLILNAGRVWTADPSHPWAESIAVRGESIAALGSREEIAHFQGPLTRILDCPDAFALPGLIDAHGHMDSLGAEQEQLSLRGVRSIEEMARLVRARSDEQPGDGWIIGRSWDQSLWPGGGFPTAEALDAVVPDRPVWLTRVDGHAGWANSEAMRRAGVTTRTASPADGQILRYPDGRPTGVFVDGAMGLVTRAIPPPSREDIARRLLAAQKVAMAHGLTGVHDAGLGTSEVEAYRGLDRAGKLKLRVYGMASPPGGGEVRFVSETRPIPAAPGHRFSLRAIKLFVDGAMGSRGALLFEPYSDDPGNRGLMLIDPKVLEETTAAALRHGWQVCTHAIGDRGNALVLDAYEKALQTVPEVKDPRLRIEHAQVVRREDVDRFRSLGVIASMQPAHAGTDQRWADARLGPERVRGAYAWRWFLDAGVPLAFGSDFPVEVLDPFWGIFAAITRQDESGQPPGGWRPEHRLTIEETLRAYTAGSAYAAFDEGRVGILRPGMAADITVLDRDPFVDTPHELRRTHTRFTIIGGEVLFDGP